jgi:hypothetical protein
MRLLSGLLLLLCFEPALATGATLASEEALRRRAADPFGRNGRQIPLVEGSFVVDGRLDESFWQEALVWRLLYEIEVGENAQAPVETYVLLTVSQDALRAAFVSLDPEPSRIRGTFADRGRWDPGTDDAVGLFLDSFGDARNAYYVIVNARGIQLDGLRLDRGGQGLNDDDSVNFLWSSAAHVGENGYTVEIELPFRYLRLEAAAGGQVQWGVMPVRYYPREFQYEMTAFPWDYNRNCFLCQVPAVSFPAPDASFRPLQTIPYVSGLAERVGDATSRGASGGVDVKYQHQAWALDATVFPDFSQVETDAFQMTTNIRFLPRLPERRPFFMERADLFRFPISSVVYTRTMLDPTAGLRWTGKQGPHNWAILTLRDRATWLLRPGLERSSVEVLEDAPSQNTLFRYRYDRSSDTVMGVFVTDREYDGGFNRFLSLDGQFALGSRHTFVVQALGSSTHYPEPVAAQFGTEGGAFGGYGYLVRLARSGRNFSYQVETRDFSPGLVTGLGFQQRVGTRQINTSPSYTFWPASPVLRNVSTWVTFNGEWDRATWDPLNVQARSGVTLIGAAQTRVSAWVQREHERLAGAPFDLNEASVLVSTTPVGWYQVGGSFNRGHAVDVRLVERMQQSRLRLDQTFFLFDRRLRLTQSTDRLRLFHAVPAQAATLHRLDAELQITRSLAVRTIGQHLDFRWQEPRYGAGVPERRRGFENQTVLRYRLNYASAFFLGFYTNRFLIDEARDTGWNVFTKFSLLL